MFSPEDIENKKTNRGIVVKENGSVDVFKANDGNILVPLINHQNALINHQNASQHNGSSNGLLPLEQKSPARKRAIPTDQTPRKRQDCTQRAAKKYTPPPPPPQVSVPPEYHSPPLNPFAVDQPPGVETPPDMAVSKTKEDKSEEEGESPHLKRMKLL